MPSQLVSWVLLGALWYSVMECMCLLLVCGAGVLGKDLVKSLVLTWTIRPRASNAAPQGMKRKAELLQSASASAPALGNAQRKLNLGPAKGPKRQKAGGATEQPRAKRTRKRSTSSWGSRSSMKFLWCKTNRQQGHESRVGMPPARGWSFARSLRLWSETSQALMAHAWPLAAVLLKLPWCCAPAPPEPWDELRLVRQPPLPAPVLHRDATVGNLVCREGLQSGQLKMAVVLKVEMPKVVKIAKMLKWRRKTRRTWHKRAPESYDPIGAHEENQSDHCPNWGQETQGWTEQLRSTTEIAM